MPAITIQQIRQKYPQYNDLSDADLADRLHQRYYADMDRGEFDSRIGMVSAYNPVEGAQIAPPVSGAAPGGGDVPWFEQGPAPEREPPSPTRGLEIGTQTVGRGLAELFGAFVDLPALGLNAGAGLANLALPEGQQLPPITDPVGGSESIAGLFAKGADAVGFPVRDPNTEMSPQERTFYDYGRLGTQALAGSGALLRRAARAPSASAVPQTRVERTMDQAAQPYSDAIDNARLPAGPSRIGLDRIPGYEATTQEIRGLRPFIADQGSAVGAATGLEMVRDMDSPIADFFATTLGALGGGVAASAPGQVGRMASGVYDRFATDPNIPLDPKANAPLHRSAPAQVSRKAARDAATAMQRRAVDPEQAATKIDENRQFYRDEGLPEPTPGLLSEDEGLIGLERRGRLSDPATFIRRDREVATAASEQMRSLSPGELTDDQRRAAQRLAERTKGEKLAGAQQNVQQAEARLQQSREAESSLAGEYVATRGDRGAASADLDRVVVDETLRPRQAERSSRFEAIDPDRDVMRSTAPFVSAVRDIETEVADLPDALRRRVMPEGLMDDLKNLEPRFVERTSESSILDPTTGRPISRTETVNEGGSGEMSFKAMNDMRPLLAEAIQSARDNRQYTLADNLKRIRREISAEADRLAEEGGPAGARAQEALRYHAEEFAPFFGRGVGQDLRRKVDSDDLHRSKSPPSATAQMFLRTGGGSREAAADLKRILRIAPDEQAGRDAARRYLVADAARAVPNDKFNVPAFRKWIDDRKDIWRSFPDLEAEFRGTLRSAVNQAERTTKLGDEIKEFRRQLNLTDQEIRGGVLQTLIDDDPVVAARRILNPNAGDAQKRMKEVTDLVRNDPEAMRAWKKSVADALQESFTTTAIGKTLDASDPVSWAKIHRDFPKYQRLLSAPNGPFNPQEMQALTRVHRLMEPYTRLNIAPTAGSDSAMNFENLMKPLEATLRGPAGLNAVHVGGIMRTIRLYLETIPGLDQSASVERLLTRAQADPEVALHLLRAPVDPQKVTTWNKRLWRLVGIGEAARESTENEDDGR